MEGNQKTRDEISRPLYCPLLSIGEKTLQSCIEGDCTWWIEYKDASREIYYAACAIKDIAASMVD